MSTVTMQELELETAELLPSRETLCYYKPPYATRTARRRPAAASSSLSASASASSTCPARTTACCAVRPEGAAQQVRRAAPGFPGRPSNYFRHRW